MLAMRTSSPVQMVPAYLMSTGVITSKIAKMSAMRKTVPQFLILCLNEHIKLLDVHKLKKSISKSKVVCLINCESVNMKKTTLMFEYS